MESERSRKGQTGTDAVRRVEQTRRLARRTPDGTLNDAVAGGLPDGPLGAVGEDVRSMVMQLAARVDDLTGELDQARRRVAELETLADEDALLPVLNRRGFMRELKRAISAIERYGTPAALICLDVDGLKAVNDAYGHSAGDDVLRDIVRRVRGSLRASDLIGRLGGDEFGAVLWTASEADAARKGVSLAAEVAATPVSVAGHLLTVGVSAGATGLKPDDTAEAALKRADEAMYRAKRGES